MNTLRKLYEQKKYLTDKTSHYNYLESYSLQFDRIRKDVKTFLEIGIYHGGSMEMWLDYFPNADIIGVDVIDQYTSTNPRIKVEIGDATHPNFIEYLVQKYGSFDIVLDDGSHRASDMRKAFNLLYQHTKYIYCIEDLLTQYKNNPWGNFLDDVTMMSTLFDLVDKNNTDYKNNDYFQVSFSPWQCFILKNEFKKLLVDRTS